MKSPTELTENYVIAIRLEDPNGSGVWMFVGSDDKPNVIEITRMGQSLLNDVAGDMSIGRATYLPNTDAGWQRWAKEQQRAKRSIDLDTRS